MRERSRPGSRAPLDGTGISIDVVTIMPRGRQLGVVCRRSPRGTGGPMLTLPWASLRDGEELAAAAKRVAESVGSPAARLDQVGAFTEGTDHPGSARLSVCFVGVQPAAADERLTPWMWSDVRATAAFGHRQRAMVGASLQEIRLRMDHAPVAFRLLGPQFTLTELQQVYELLLGRRLHKASFRRALLASWLVEPTSEWRGPARGRPAQLFRYSPRRRRRPGRAVRFDLQ